MPSEANSDVAGFDEWFNGTQLDRCHKNVMYQRMPNLLLLGLANLDWHTPLFEAIASRYTTTLLGLAELDTLERGVRFDASIVPLNALRFLRSTEPYERLGAILVVADRADENGRIAAFAWGATDCIASDISGAELNARLAAIFRRCAGAPTTPQLTQSLSGTWYLNVTRRYLVSPHGQRIELPGSTFEIFLALASRPRRVLSRSFLVVALGNGKHADTRSIDVIITRLRKILDRNCPSGAAMIGTVRNEGYQLARDVQRDEHGFRIQDV